MGKINNTEIRNFIKNNIYTYKYGSRIFWTSLTQRVAEEFPNQNITYDKVRGITLRLLNNIEQADHNIEATYRRRFR